MKFLLILIVTIALFLHFYPQPEVTKFYDEQKQMLTDGFEKFGDTKVRLKADKIFSDLKPKLNQFSVEEVKYLKEITLSKESVKSFFDQFCKNQDRSIIFHSGNQMTVCKTIRQYESML